MTAPTRFPIVGAYGGGMELLTPVLWLALTVYHEARGEDDLGQRAVAHVILNRSNQSNLPIKAVVLKPNQFSCYNSGVKLPDDMKTFDRVYENVKVAMASKDFTIGAEYYHSTLVSPYWKDNYVRVGTIGNHIFYRRK